MSETREIVVKLTERQWQLAEEIGELAAIDAAQAVQIIVNRNLTTLHSLFTRGFPCDDDEEESDD